MSRALVAGGSLGGLTAALVLRDQGWDVDVLERSAVPLQDRGAGIVLHPTTVRYLVERVGKAIGDIGVPASRLRYLGDDGSVVDEQPCAYRFASYFELYQGLLDAFGTEHYHLSNQLAHLDNRDDEVTLSLTDGQTLAADLVVCADGIRSTARSILVPDAQPRYVGYVAWRGTIERDELSGRTASVLQDAITYRILPHGHLLTYPIPGKDGSVLCNWLWYRNVAPGDHLTDLLTDRNGLRAELTVPPGSVQTKHLEALHSAADTELPSAIAELVQRSAEPFVQVIVDLEVPQMAFGRSCLIGDAAFAAAAAHRCGHRKGGRRCLAARQRAAGRHWTADTRSAEGMGGSAATGGPAGHAKGSGGGRSVQFEGTWRVGDPSPFGLQAAGDSALPVVEQKGISNA